PVPRGSLGLVADLPHDVVAVVERLRDLAHVGLLQLRHRRDERALDLGPTPVVVGIAVDPRDVVVAVEGMPAPGIPLPAPLAGEAPSVEEHHGDVDAGVAGGAEPGPQPVEVRLVEAVQIEAGAAVEGEAGPGAG